MTTLYEPGSLTIVAPQVLLGNHLKALKLPTFVREYEKVAMESPRIAPTIRAICFDCANWSASTASGVTSNVVFASHAFHRPRASTHSTSPRSRRSTSRWFWNWRGANGSRSDRTASRSGHPAPAKPTSAWHWDWPPARKTTASPSPRPPPSCTSSWKRATNVGCGRCKNTSTRSNC